MADATQAGADTPSRPGTRIENLMIANHAEVVNGLLYISGGCWTRHHRAKPKEGESAPRSTFGIAMTVIVPWTEANRPHAVTVTIESEDDPQHPVVNVKGELTVGRPPDAKPGSEQRAAFAVNTNVQFPKPGGYSLKAVLSNGDVRSVSFEVIDRSS